MDSYYVSGNFKIAHYNCDDLFAGIHMSFIKNSIERTNPDAVFLSDLNVKCNLKKNIIEFYIPGYFLLFHPEVFRTGILLKKQKFQQEHSVIVSHFCDFENGSNLSTFRSRTIHLLHVRACTISNRTVNLISI